MFLQPGRLAFPEPVTAGQMHRQCVESWRVL